MSGLSLFGVDELVDRNDERRIARDPRLAVDETGELAERLQAVLRARTSFVLVHPLDLLARRACAELTAEIVDVDPRVPEIHVAHRRELVDRLAIGAADCGIDPRAHLGAEAAVAAGDGEARHETLDVPLERAGKCLVEIVDAEDQRGGPARRRPRSSRDARHRRAARAAPSGGCPARSQAISAAAPR